MLSKYGNCTRLLKITNKLKIGCFYKVGKNSRYFVGVFNNTIIPFALVGYEMIIANSALRGLLAIIMSYPVRTRGIFVKYLINFAIVSVQRTFIFVFHLHVLCMFFPGKGTVDRPYPSGKDILD